VHFLFLGKNTNTKSYGTAAHPAPCYKLSSPFSAFKKVLCGEGEWLLTKMRPPLLPTLLLLLLAASSANDIPVTDPALSFSAFNWAVTPTSATASNPGASLKVGFTNTTSASLLLDTSASTTPSACVVLVYSLDDAPWVYVTPSPGNATLALPLSPSSSPLSVSAVHDVRLFLYASCETADRWLQSPASAGGNAFLVVTGLRLDDGGVAVPPPGLFPSAALVYGDSITEGTNAQNFDYATGVCGGGEGLRNNGATDSWAFAFAAALRVELSLAAFAAQGFATKNSLNYGHVPPLFTPGADAASAWDKVNAATSRLPLLAANPPALVVNALGFNDQNSDVTPSQLTAVVAAWLAAARAALGANTTLALAIPFGGEMRTQNATRLAILAGFAEYQQSGGGGGGGDNADPCAVALDLYPRAQRGLQGLGSPTAESCDGTHPLARAHASLGAMLAAAATAALDAAPERCTRPLQDGA
jgi:lysophospholipase L1-like esterase